MKKMILGTFGSRPNAEGLIEYLRSEMNIAADDISFIYRGDDGEVKEVGSGKSMTPAGEATTGAVVGGSVGALAGLATIAGVIPVIGPIFAAGPIIAALGIGAGALGTTAAGALTGAIAGGIIGALSGLGVSESEAQAYEESVRAGNVLVVVHAEDDAAVTKAFEDRDARSVHVYTPTI